MGDRFSIYQGALMHLGDGQIVSLTEANPKRHALDKVWDKSVNLLLEKAFWNFAIRTVEISPDTDYDPLFGYAYSFRKPDDWVRTNSISDDPYFTRGYEEYHDEGDYWFAAIDRLYIRYVSDDPLYGWNEGRWREGFCHALEALLAFRCGLPISNDKGNRNDLWTLYEKLVKDAKILDAVDEAVVHQPPGRLVSSRFRSGSRMNSRNQ
jgi:hypothetical protein